jgi:hypothetical protein
MGFELVGVLGHLLDNVELSYDDNQNRGSSGYHWGKEEHRRQGNEWAHRPTRDKDIQVSIKSIILVFH